MITAFRERIAARLPKGRVARAIITLASGTAMAQAITICAMPIVTRLYTPAQIGVISLFLAFFGFWATTLSLRYEYALLIAKDDAESHVVHRLAIVLVVVMSVLGFPILWGLHHTGVLGFGLVPAWAPFVAVPALLGYGIFIVYRSWALRAGMVKRITKATVAKSAANAATRVGLGFFGGGVPGLFAAELAGACGAMLELMRGVRRHFAPSKPVTIPRRDLATVARKFFKFAAFETPSAWVNQLALMLPVPMVASLHGATAAGWFGMARGIVAIPNTQIGAAVADAFHMEAANSFTSGDFSRTKHIFYKLLRKLAAFGLVPMVLVIAMAPWVIPWMLGHGWNMAGWTAAALAPWLYVSLIASPLSRILAVLQAQQYKLVYDLASVAGLLLAFGLAQNRQWSYMQIVLAVCVAGIIANILYICVLVIVVEIRLKHA